MSGAPRLTIGVPAYRNEKTIARTLDSVLAHSEGGFRVLISDDLSPDGTDDICRAYAARDPRVSYVRQERDLDYDDFRYLARATWGRPPLVDLRNRHVAWRANP